jgi:hypothetical protein
MTTQAMDRALERPFNGEALVGRLFEQALGAFELFNVQTDDRHRLTFERLQGLLPR